MSYKFFVEVISGPKLNPRANGMCAVDFFYIRIGLRLGDDGLRLILYKMSVDPISKSGIPQ